MKAMVCKCCGAPLHGYKCDYCGTEYERNMIKWLESEVI